MRETAKKWYSEFRNDVRISICIVFAVILSLLNTDGNKMYGLSNEVYATRTVKAAPITVMENMPVITEKEVPKVTQRNGFDEVSIDDKTRKVYETTLECIEEKPVDTNIEFMAEPEMVHDTIQVMVEAYNAEPIPEIVKTVNSSQFSEEEIYLMAKVVQAEAGNQEEEGIRLVIDVLLNQYDSGRYGTTMTDVIYYENNYETITNGSADSANPPERIYELINEEIAARMNYDVMFFRTEHYHTFGTPLFQNQDHFFSGL